MKEFKVLPMIWDEFLKQLCVECELNREQPETFLVRFADENAKKHEQEIAAILKISVETYKKRIGGVYKKLAKRYPQIKNIHHKFEPLHSLLKKEYKQLVEQDTEAFATNEIAPPDWYKICREMLESQKRSIRRQATEIVSEPFYVQLGLVERKHQPRRSGDLSFSPEQGSGFFQLDKEETIKRYEHDEFLEQVIKQRQSKSEGRRITIIGEPGAGKTTLLESIAFSSKTPGFPIWISLGSLGEKSLQEYLCQNWLKQALKTSDVTQQQKALEELFKSRQVLLLLDGVDEMPAPSPVEALAKIREELTGWVADAQVVLTCRINVWDASINALQGFDTYRTLEFSYGDGNKCEQVRQFICQWFSKAGKPELGEPLREKLDEDRYQRIRDLVKNPLRLSLLCQSWYFRQGDLPKTKAALYEQFTRAFYDWKEEQFPTTPTQRKELNAALGLLAREAIDKEKSRFGIRRDFALDLMGEYLFNLATEKLNWLVHVYNDADTGQPVYAFFHPTFQEYFAACAISDWDYFLKHASQNPTQGTYRIFDRQWKEVILLWLGRDDVLKPHKEDFIATLVHFEDECWDFYWYRAFFLAAVGIAEFRDCIGADWIVANLVEYATEHDPPTGVDRVVNPAIWTTLLETDHTRAINVLIDKLYSDFLDEDARWKVFNSLMQIGTGNSKVIAALTKLMDTSLDDQELPLEAAFFLGKIDPDKQAAINFLEQQLWNTDLPDWVRHKAAYLLGEIDGSNEEAIKFLTELIERNKSLDLDAASTLGKIAPGNPKAIATLTELLKTERGDRFLNIALIAACNLLEIDLENLNAIRVLREFINPSQKAWERLQAASALGKTKQGKKEAIKVLCELMHEAVEIAQDIQLSKAVISSLNQIDRRILAPSPRGVQSTFSGEDNLEYVAAQLAFCKSCLSHEIGINVRDIAILMLVRYNVNSSASIIKITNETSFN